MKILTFFKNAIRNIRTKLILAKHDKLWENCPKNPSFEEYMDYLKTLPKLYQWPLEGLDKLQMKRKEIQEEFPFVITYKGGYNLGIHDDMEEWCREQFGDEHGECRWDGCPDGYEYWYEQAGLEDILDKKLEVCGPRPSHDDEELWDKWQEQSNVIINEHFKMVDARIDAPGDHSHWGVWRTLWLGKTGYDYGYQDYYFKNVEDAMFFKIMWDEHAS